MSSAIVQLLVLAGVAIFLILRLRNVLGTRDGFEPPKTIGDQASNQSSRSNFEVIEGGPDHDILDHVPDGSEAAKSLAAMKLAEPSFSVGEFLQGARGAYEMILMAFERGELDDIKPFLAEDVFDTFVDVVAAREDQGLIVEASFAGLREMSVQDATFDRATNEGEITVRFVGELTSVVRDKAGDIVEGDPKAIKRQKDVWTFGRVMGADDPNWRLVATGG
ncbi:Tim44/TimA family putative adaptor protein [Aliiroseovarius sp. PTFE2010]|uniref:Tim44/TimA family putative adaptor protein n=1 Tax=Aliiroseovarius sp. PTFE2010 TaxID=3417190 RepID=UPI003CF34A4D